MRISKLRHWKHADAGWLRDMDYACFPLDTSFHNTENHHWWVLYLDDGTLAAYAGLRIERIRGDRVVAHLTRCGVLPGFRGRGLQRRLIEARLRWCARRGDVRLVKTYTNGDNRASAENLGRFGFSSRRKGEWLLFRKVLR